MNCTFRKPEIKDLQRLQVLEAASHISPWSVTILKNQIENPLGLNLMSENQSGEILSYLLSIIVNAEIEIHNIVTNPLYRRQGWAKLLINQLIKMAEEKEVNKIFLEVRESNISAIALYRHFGFEKYCVRKQYYENNNENAILMKKELQNEKYRNF